MQPSRNEETLKKKQRVCDTWPLTYQRTPLPVLSVGENEAEIFSQNSLQENA